MSTFGPRQEPRGFAHVETWVFDLDNTLYPHHLSLWEQVDTRIRDFTADFLKVGPEKAFRIHNDYYRRYGTTLRGLMTEHGLHPDDFLEFVHAIDHSPLEPDPALGAAIERLGGRKLILTNGTRKHAGPSRQTRRDARTRRQTAAAKVGAVSGARWAARSRRHGSDQARAARGRSVFLVAEKGASRPLSQHFDATEFY
jgi:hypothetical protein